MLTKELKERKVNIAVIMETKLYWRAPRSWHLLV